MWVSDLDLWGLDNQKEAHVGYCRKVTYILVVTDLLDDEDYYQGLAVQVRVNLEHRVVDFVLEGTLELI